MFIMMEFAAATALYLCLGMALLTAGRVMPAMIARALRRQDPELTSAEPTTTRVVAWSLWGLYLLLWPVLVIQAVFIAVSRSR